MRRYVPLLILFLVASCKEVKKDEDIPNFDLSSTRIVDIKINDEIKSALNVLTSSDVEMTFNCPSDCQLKKVDSSGAITKKVSFYFEINETKKNLIVVEDEFNNCLYNDCNIYLQSVIRNIIPIGNIDRVDLADMEYGNKKNNNGDDIKSIFIHADFNENLFKQKIVQRYRNPPGDEIKYMDREFNNNCVIIDVKIQNAIRIKGAIERLMLEYKK